MNQALKLSHRLLSPTNVAVDTLEPPRASPLPIAFRSLGAVAFLVEFMLVAMSSVLVGLGSHWLLVGFQSDVGVTLGLGFLVAANYTAMVAAQGNYRTINLRDFKKQAIVCSVVWLMIWFILLAVAFLIKITGQFSRGATITYFSVGLMVVLSWRAALTYTVRGALRTRGFAEQPVIVIAQEGQLPKSTVLRELQKCGYRPARIVEISSHEISKFGLASTTRALINEAVLAARAEQIQEIFLLIRWDHRRCVEQVLSALAVLPASVHLLPDENVTQFLGNSVSRIGTALTAELKRAPLSEAEQYLKRGMDIAVATTALLILWPVLLLTAALIKLESAGPVIFTQTRNGFNGRRFRIFKFRSMRVQEDGSTIRQATKNDDRITPLGRILRRSSIDELPQLFNVLLGDMSVVGPRPHAAAHNTEYEKLIANYAFRYHVKPGITGWAQVNGCRGETNTVGLMAHRVDLDLWYINHWTVWLDLTIIFRTAFSRLAWEGAY
jgi:Undecaprenyl-phosphate glucose phosphotransferase